MKLIKYLFWILLLMGSLAFLLKFNDLNQFAGNAITIKIPYLVDMQGYENGFKVWQVLIMTLTSGVIIGFLLAFFQILAHKTDVFSLKSKLRRMQVELDNLRNQSIEDDMDIIDEMNDSSL